MVGNGSTYGYQCIIKELAKQFESQFECLGETTEKYITFSASIKTELDTGKTISYKIKFNHSLIFMSNTLSNLLDNLSERLYNDKNTDYKSCLDDLSFNGNQLILDVFGVRVFIKKTFNIDLNKTFDSTYEFCDRDINKFIVLSRKRVYLYEYMNGARDLIKKIILQ